MHQNGAHVLLGGSLTLELRRRGNSGSLPRSINRPAQTGGLYAFRILSNGHSRAMD